MTRYTITFRKQWHHSNMAPYIAYSNMAPYIAVLSLWYLKIATVFVWRDWDVGGSWRSGLLWNSGGHGAPLPFFFFVGFHFLTPILSSHGDLDPWFSSLYRPFLVPLRSQPLSCPFLRNYSVIFAACFMVQKLRNLKKKEKVIKYFFFIKVARSNQLLQNCVRVGLAELHEMCPRRVVAFLWPFERSVFVRIASAGIGDSSEMDGA